MENKKNLTTTKDFNEILLYTTPNGNVKVETCLQNETIWLTQQKIADLFGVQRPAITRHLKNIFETGELKEEVVSSILEHTTPLGAIEGKSQVVKTKYYNALLVLKTSNNSHNSFNQATGKWISIMNAINIISKTKLSE